MGLTPELISMAQHAVASKPRKFVTPAILLSVALQESGGVNTFDPKDEADPAKLYHQNLQAACTYYKRRKVKDVWIRLGPFHTGFTPADIKRLITFPEKIGDFVVPEALRGLPAKFRLEPAYWENRDIQRLPKEDRFYASCSWGIVQFMAPNISKGYDIQFIRRWSADIPMQLLYAAGELDRLLIAAGGDVNRMYRGYNSGNIDSTNRDVVARATLVENRCRQIAGQLKGAK